MRYGYEDLQIQIHSEVETPQEELHERLPERHGAPVAVALARLVLAVADDPQPLQVPRLRRLLLDVDGVVEDGNVAPDGKAVVPEELRFLQILTLDELAAAQDLAVLAEGGRVGLAARPARPVAVTHQGEAVLDDDVVVVPGGGGVVFELEDDGDEAGVLRAAPVGEELDPPCVARRLEAARVDAPAVAVHGLDPLVALDLEHVALGGRRRGGGCGHGDLCRRRRHSSLVTYLAGRSIG